MEEKLFDLMTKMYNKIESIDNEIQDMKSEMQDMKSEIKTLGNQVTSLENKVDDKFGALFDGNTQTTHKLDSVAADVCELKEEVLNVEVLTMSNRADIIKLKRI